jgi:hypothetical protein
MAAKYPGTVVAMDFPFTVSPSGGGLGIFAQEEKHNAYAVLGGYTPSLHAPDREHCVALVTVRGLTQLVYGYPNEEAFWKDPRGGLDHGVAEIVGSSWHESISTYNKASFGTAFDWSAKAPRHFFIGSKDSSAQFLALDIELEVFTDEPLGTAWDNVTAEALRRLNSHPEP